MDAKVMGLYRYPVQSVRGEELKTATFGPAGVIGDRAFGIADLELGVIAHASRAKKQYRALITWNARYLSEPRLDAEMPVVELDFADGTTIGYGRQQIDKKGSRFILPVQAKARMAEPYRGLFDYHCKLNMPADPISTAARADCVN